MNRSPIDDACAQYMQLDRQLGQNQLKLQECSSRWLDLANAQSLDECRLIRNGKSVCTFRIKTVSASAEDSDSQN